VKKLAFILTLAAALSSCGSERTVEQQQPPPAPAPGGGGGAPAQGFAAIQPILQKSCARCHAQAGFIKTEQAFRASASKARVQSGNMPQANSPEAQAFSAQDKAAILAF
jgi:uncharacterized membrane protein